MIGQLTDASSNTARRMVPLVHRRSGVKYDTCGAYDELIQDVPASLTGRYDDEDATTSRFLPPVALLRQLDPSVSLLSLTREGDRV